MWHEYGARHLVQALYDKASVRPTRTPRLDPYVLTNFQVWHYAKYDPLPFDDDSFDFVFSEHFFEHLFLDEAIALLSECRRVLRPQGVLRTAVPDADLRVDLPPEPLGFPSKKLSWNHPAKHKTRWSFYMLQEALRVTGFESVPVRFCDRDGHLVYDDPALNEVYSKCPDRRMIDTLSYLMRGHSLIVDGIKPCN
jgi:predicted SAM-dependent methyltransferase